MRVLVTGGAGYIGSVVTAQLVERGHSVLVFDNLSTGHREAVSSLADFTSGDVRDRDPLVAVLGRERFDAVMHFAAESLVEKSVREPEAFYDTNVIGGLNLLDAMRRTGTKTLIFSSTAAVYGEPETIPIPESHSTIPINAYGASKIAFERALSWYESAHGLRHVSLRYFNVCGATESLGEDRAVETHLIPLAIDAALGKRDLAIFGSDYDTPDGSCVRDYIHVSDIADAHIRVVEEISRVKQPAYNVGTGTGFSNLEIVESTRRVSGNNFPVRIATRRAGDPAKLVADATRFTRDFDWRARHMDLDEIVRSVLAWRGRRHA